MKSRHHFKTIQRPTIATPFPGEDQADQRLCATTVPRADILGSAVCCLLSAVCCLLSAVCCLLPAVCCLLSAICYLLSAVCCLLSAVCCLLSAICYLLSAVCCLVSSCCLLFVVCCLLLAVTNARALQLFIVQIFSVLLTALPSSPSQFLTVQIPH
jgi:hypothetical protein